MFSLFFHLFLIFSAATLFGFPVQNYREGLRPPPPQQSGTFSTDWRRIDWLRPTHGLGGERLSEACSDLWKARPNEETDRRDTEAAKRKVTKQTMQVAKLNPKGALCGR